MRYAEKIGSKFRQVPGAVHGFGIHQIRGKNFGVPMLARVKIEHEVGECPLELGTQVPVHRKARAGELRCAFQIENAKVGPQIPMWLRSEIKFRRRAPAPHFHIFLRAVADRHAGVRQIGHAGENLPQPRIKIGSSFLKISDPLAQFLGLGHGCAGVLARLFLLCNLLGSSVALRLTGFRFRDRLPAALVDLAEILEHGRRVHAALPQLLLHNWQIVTYEIQIKHGK